jgi:hypothetical protein
MLLFTTVTVTVTKNPPMYPLKQCWCELSQLLAVSGMRASMVTYWLPIGYYWYTYFI